MNNKKTLRRMFDNYALKALKADKKSQHEASTTLRWLDCFLLGEEIYNLEVARVQYLNQTSNAKTKTDAKQNFNIACKVVRTRLFK